MTVYSTVIFVCNARDYHTIDLCGALQNFLPQNSCLYITDCMESEGYDRIISTSNSIKKLLVIDPFLFPNQSTASNLWRNLLKLFLSPLQAALLKIYIGNPTGKIIHAHTFYYGLLCRLALIPFFFTPQGGELTERPNQSRIYKFLIQWVLSGAIHTFVDSKRMFDMARSLTRSNVSIHQYGIDTKSCINADSGYERWRIISNRGLESNYQIDLIQEARDFSGIDLPITFFYPLFDSNYSDYIRRGMKASDTDLGRIDKHSCYKLYAEAQLVVSIPISDSSPRSVYEAIFCGAPVVTTYSRWVEDLPPSMRDRVLIIDPQSFGWFNTAITWAKQCLKQPFIPCEVSLGKFDQFFLASEIVQKYYLPYSLAKLY